MSMIEYKN